MLKVVFHIDETEKWSMTLGNIRNLLKEKAEVEVVVVVNGPAIIGYLKANIRTQIEELPETMVSFEACQNAMRSQQLAIKDLPDGVTAVPAGVVRLIELQNQGFAYIKP